MCSAILGVQRTHVALFGLMLFDISNNNRPRGSALQSGLSIRLFVVLVSLLAAGIGSNNAASMAGGDKSKISAMLTEKGKKMDTFEVSKLLDDLGGSYKDSNIDDVQLLIDIRREDPSRCGDLAVFERLKKKYLDTPLHNYLKFEQYYVSTFCRHFGSGRDLSLSLRMVKDSVLKDQPDDFVFERFPELKGLNFSQIYPPLIKKGAHMNYMDIEYVLRSLGNKHYESKILLPFLKDDIPNCFNYQEFEDMRKLYLDTPLEYYINVNERGFKDTCEHEKQDDYLRRTSKSERPN